MSSAPDDYYAVLGVAPTATQKEISRAFRTLMRTRHPDVDAAAATPTSSEVLGIMRAFSVLKDPKKRADYDRGGRGRTRRPGREGSGREASGREASGRETSGREASGREATGRETAGQDGARGQPAGERPVRRMPQDIPVRRVPRDVPPHTNAAPATAFRVTPVRWEQGPWTGHGEVKRRRTT